MGSALALSNLLVGGSILLAGAVGVVSWRQRPRPGAAMLAGFMAAMSVWHGAHLIDHAVGGPTSGALERLRWLGAGTAASWWILFVLSYTGRDHLIDRRTVALVFAFPVAFNVAIWLPALGGIAGVGAFDGLWQSIHAEEHPLFWGQVLLSYGLLAAGTVLLLQYSYRTNSLLRKQGLAIQASLLLVWVASIVSLFELFGEIHLHALPVGFLLSGLPLLWAIAIPDLSSVTPIARATVFETIDAAVVVIDDDGTIVDTNPQAGALLGIDGETALGSDFRSVFGSLPELEAPERLLADGGTQAYDVGGARVRFDVSPVTAGDERIGHVLVGYDVTEQHRRQAELRRKNERLDAFASVVSHDLRSPLQVAAGKLELAAEECGSPHHDDVGDALDRMDAMIDDVLTLAREGQVVGDVEPVAVSDLARGTWDGMRTGGATLDVEDPLPRIEADPDRLCELLENLFRNSIEHGSQSDSTPADPTLHVTVGPLTDDRGETEGFYVADDGRGIASEAHDRVFERGYSTAEDGTGFGLAIVERIARAHDWSVDVTDSESGGARFEITGTDGD